MRGRIGILGIMTFIGATGLLAPGIARANDPLPTTGAAWLFINLAGVTGGATDPSHKGWSDISEFNFEFVKASSGPGQSLTSIKIERPLTQFQKSFGLGIGKQMGDTISVDLRKAASGGSADDYRAELKNAKVSVDEVRSSKGSNTGLEILVLSFSSVSMYHRTQTAQGYSTYALVPNWFDIKGNVYYPPSSNGASAGGASRPTAVRH